MSQWNGYHCLMSIIPAKFLWNLTRSLGNLSADGQRQHDGAGKDNISLPERKDRGLGKLNADNLSLSPQQGVNIYNH